MVCHNHANATAVATCAGCAEPYCDNCLVTVKGQRYCSGCKGLAVPQLDAGPTRRCVEADEALKLALFSILCFGLITGPIAISKALAAKRQIADDPALEGVGTANAAIAIAAVTFTLNILGILGRANGGP